MKKALTFIGCFTFIIASCADSGSSSNTQDTTPVSSQTNNENRSLADTLGETGGTTGELTEFKKGKQLIASSDCLGCHKEYEKLIGPAYSEVASKYEDTDKNKAYLADKIIKGGSGVWGEIPMTAHPSISENDAAEMVKYILSLK